MGNKSDAGDYAIFQLLRVSVNGSLGGFCTEYVYGIQQSTFSLEDPFRRHAVNAEALVEPVLVKHVFGASWY